MDVIIKNLFLEQIRLKLQLVDGEVKKSKVQKIMKYCVRHISAAIKDRQVETFSSRLPKWSTWHAIPNKTSPLPLPATLPPLPPPPPPSADDLIQQLELQIMNQDVCQI